jgi:cell division septal protein FtsQ
MSEVARPFPKKQFKKPLVYFYEKKKSNPQKSLINFKPYIRIWDRFHKPVLISGFLILLLSAILYVILFSGFFRIKSVKILGAEKFVNANDVIRISVQNTQDQNLLLFDTPGLQANLTRVFHGAKNFSVGKKYPDTLIVYVQERKPIALVHNTNSLEYYLVDEDGFVLGTIEETESNLPKVVYEGELKIGSAINKDLIPAYINSYSTIGTNSNIGS